MEELFKKIKKNHWIRFYPGQTRNFRKFIVNEFHQLGYDDVNVDHAGNVIVGDISKAKTVYSAHYDTPMLLPAILLRQFWGQAFGILGAALVMCLSFSLLKSSSTIPVIMFSLMLIMAFLLPNTNNANDNTSGVLGVYGIAKALKERGQANEDVAFLLFNGEEWGLVGSGRFVRKFKKTYRMKPAFRLINLDCVGVGDKVLLAAKASHVRAFCREYAKNFNNEVIFEKANLLYAGSDNLNFENGMMISATRRSKLGPFYLPYIHTPFDREIEFDTLENICNAVVEAHGKLDDNTANTSFTFEKPKT